MTDPRELAAADLRCACDADLFDFKTTAELEPLDEVIGQRRAVQAIAFGLDMASPGYNIFVTGRDGTGKSTITQDLVRRFAANRPTPDDWLMVNNFKDEYRPRPIRMPAGQGAFFARKIGRVVQDLKVALPSALENESYLERRGVLEKNYAEKRARLLDQLEKLAAAEGLQISRTPAGFIPVPIIDGKPATQESFQQLSEEKRGEIEGSIAAVQTELEAVGKEIGRLKQTLQNEIEKLTAEVTRFVVSNRLSILKEEYRGLTAIIGFLDELQQDIVENVALFAGGAAGEEGRGPQPGPPTDLVRYDVNILVDRSDARGAPVIFESNPTYQNLFGRIEKRALMGTLTSDFTMVKPGSLLSADGGTLIMEMEQVLLNPHVWDGLKRALQNKQLHIEDLAAGPLLGSVGLRPAPIPIDVKVILLGGYELFQALQNQDSKFNRIFKVRADFDDEVERSPATIQLYARFIARVCREEQLLPFTPSGVAAIVEYSQKSTSNRGRLSLRFGQVIGVLKEADYWARRQGVEAVTDTQVVKAFSEYRFRYNLYEEKIHEAYADGSILIDVSGAAVGQVNGLAVHQIGEISFGRPARITAETYLGPPNVINIEREADLSGRTHDKGVLILTGYLGRTFAQRYPLSLTISIAFEQSYAGVDGDSASSAELFAIISSLSGVPLKQGVAVTGSVNQKGRIQSIGGVNQKIEGFFEVCQFKGFTGDQGVVIPAGNVQNLMLKRAVVEAVREGRFHIYPIQTAAEGIAILTGMSAGEPNRFGNYPATTVYGRAQKKLKQFFDRTQKQHNVA
ncbi:MAG: AAA family ATPase [Desulfobacteraceae bacterium]|nr:AAA family ATPase [Desulfobacteraceae bacterium]